MNQRIQDFYQQASTRNFSRDYQFRILNFSVNGLGFISEEDLVFCKSGSIPQKTITAVDMPFMGVNFNCPGGVTFPDNKAWKASFYCTQDFAIREMVEASMDDTFDLSSTEARLEPRDLTQYSIELGLLDDQLNIIRTYNLLGAYIVNVGTMEYKISDGTGAVMSLDVTLAYQYWTTSLAGVGGGSGAGGLAGLANKLAKIGRVFNNAGRVVSGVDNVIKSAGRIFK
jgi:hypothetical protein